MTHNTKMTILVGVTIASAAVPLLLSPVPQDPAFHRFADSRAWLGIPNLGKSYYDNADEKPVNIGGTSMSFRRNRSPILSETYILIGEVDIYSDFFIDNIAVRL